VQTPPEDASATRGQRFTHRKVAPSLGEKVMVFLSALKFSKNERKTDFILVGEIDWKYAIIGTED